MLFVLVSGDETLQLLLYVFDKSREDTVADPVNEEIFGNAFYCAIVGKVFTFFLHQIQYEANNFTKHR